MLPDDETDRLTEAVDDAISRVAEARLADDYTLLLDGLERAQAMRNGGEPWAWELVARWQEACDHYAESYSVRLT